ncbi:unnamed protein product [Durusdinium trenchii]|uniref:Sulfotransferase n=1 Tax=Durusdinium trenchii TaxID=1381693 RepID=A0ABP0KJY2_9DINO
MSFLTAHSCPSTRQLYCPPHLPLAIQATLKAASRSTGLWAAMLEGLLPALTAVRRAITASLQDEATSASLGDATFKRFAREWIEHEALRLGCDQGYWERNLNSIAGRHLQDELPMLGLPLGLCPTCCLHGHWRLRVVILRNPFSRLASYWGDWRKRKGKQLAPEMTFEVWLSEFLSDAPNSSLFDARDAFHVEPAFQRPLRPNQEVVFLVEDPRGSLHRLEQRLCDAPWHLCLSLPPFPGGAEGAQRRQHQMPWSASNLLKVLHRYRFDLAAEQFARQEESQAARRRAFQAYFADEGHCTTSQCDFFQVPRAREFSVDRMQRPVVASSFLGAIEAPAASSTVRVLTAAPPLRSSFTMYHGDFRSELCSDGEAMRIDPEGKPYLVDTQARHDVQLDFALMIALVIFVGTAVAGVTFGMNQAKNREASAGSEAFDAPVAAVAGAGAVASPAAKTKAKAKPKPKPKAQS